jgi:hypothetical protein
MAIHILRASFPSREPSSGRFLSLPSPSPPPAPFPFWSLATCHSLSGPATTLQRLILLHRQPPQEHGRCKPVGARRPRYPLVFSPQTVLPNFDLRRPLAKHRRYIRTCRTPRLPFPSARACVQDFKNHVQDVHGVTLRNPWYVR